jgi:hypothetical protein
MPDSLDFFRFFVQPDTGGRRESCGQNFDHKMHTSHLVAVLLFLSFSHSYRIGRNQQFAHASSQSVKVTTTVPNKGFCFSFPQILTAPNRRGSEMMCERSAPESPQLTTFDMWESKPSRRAVLESASMAFATLFAPAAPTHAEGAPEQVGR